MKVLTVEERKLLKGTMFTLIQSHEYIVTYSRIIQNDLKFCKVTLIVEIECLESESITSHDHHLCDPIINTL